MLIVALAALAPAAHATAPTYICMTAKCHPGLAEAAFIHGPMATGMCPICHDEGRASDKALPEGHPDSRLNPSPEKCLLCHEEIRALMNLGFVHTPVADGDCVDCHDPHKGDNSHFLLDAPAMVDGRRVISATCLACHEAGDSSWFDDFHATEAILDCTICHNAHASQERFQLTRYVRDVYLRSAVMDGEELREQGNLDGAAAFFAKALSVFPEDVTTALLLGEVQLAREKWQSAFETYAGILDSHPRHVDALIGAGDAVIGSDGPSEALTYYKKALDADPGHVDLHVRIGNIYRERGQLQESLAMLGKAAGLAPDNPLVYEGLAETYEAMGSADEAAKVREKLEELRRK